MIKNNRRAYSIVIGLVLVCFLVLLDQLGKQWAVTQLKGQENIIWIKGVFELKYLENRGAAFGILQNQQWLFILLFFLFVFVVVVLYCRMPLCRHYVPLYVIAIFLMAGGLGNLIDRVRLGYVVDFFYFSLIDFPIFNVADIYVTVSMTVLILLFIFYYKEEDLDCLFSIFSRNKEHMR